MKMKVYLFTSICRGGPIGPEARAVSTISSGPATTPPANLFETYVLDQMRKFPGIQFSQHMYFDELSVEDLERYLAIAKQE